MSEQPDLRDFPALVDLGEQLQRAFAVEVEAERKRVRHRRSRRMVLALAAVLVLVPSAVGTKNVWAPTPDLVDPAHGVQQSRNVQLASGRSPQAWTFSAQDSGRGRCFHLQVTATQSGGCSMAVPVERVLDVRILQSDQASFVFGVTSTQVQQVRIVTRTGQVLLPTRTPDPGLARRAGLFTDFRYFVWSSAAAMDPQMLVGVQALDAAGRVLDVFPRPKAHRHHAR